LKLRLKNKVSKTPGLEVYLTKKINKLRLNTSYGLNAFFF